MTEPEMPECKRLVAVADDSHKIGEFLDWLNDNGIHLAAELHHKPCTHQEGPRIGSWTRGEAGPLDRKWRCDDGRLVGHPESEDPGLDMGECPECDGTGRVERVEPLLVPHTEPYNQLLARFYGIDLDRVEEERRQLLDHLAGAQ